MSSLRSLQNVSIVLLCLWILTLLQALSDLFDEFEVFPYESPAQQYRQQAFRQAIKKRRYHPGMKHHHRNRTRSHNHSSGILDGNRAGEDVLYKQPRGRSNKKQLPPHGRNIFRRGSKSEPLNLPKPVIVVGFPKAGTSSVFAFFRRQKRALKCQHWVRTYGHRHCFRVHFHSPLARLAPVLLLQSKRRTGGWTRSHGGLHAAKPNPQSHNFS